MIANRTTLCLGIMLIWLSACNAISNQASSSKGDPGAAATSTATGATTNAGNCVVTQGQGCIGGFISHGTALTMSFADTGSKVTFRDAADVFDRFSEAFIEPIMKQAGHDPKDFTVTLTPEVKRDNFAIGFYQFLEGTKAYDKKTITAEGNFSYSPIDSGTYLYRMVKEITLTQTAKTGGDPLVQCLVFEFSKDNVAIDVNTAANQISQLGGIKEFQFYVRKNYGACSGSTTLPPIGPAVPSGSTTKTTTTTNSVAVVGGYAVAGATAPTALTLSGDRFYITSSDCTSSRRPIWVFNKASQATETALSTSAPCGSPVNSLATQGDSLYVLSGTTMAPVTISTAAASTVVDLTSIGYSSGQLTGGLVEAGIFYAMESKNFLSTKILAFSLTGAASPAISLTGGDSGQLVGLAKLGANFYAARVPQAGQASILKISPTGTVTTTYTVTGLGTDEKVVGLQSDGTAIWALTDKAKLWKVGAMN